MRLVVVGNGTGQFGFSEPPRFAFIGPVDTKVDHKIQLLRTATLLQELDGAPITASSLLGALDALNRCVERTFSRGCPAVTVKRSVAPTTWQLEQAAASFVCEDPILSLPGFGLPYKVIDKQLMTEDVRTIDSAELNFLLDIASSAYAVEDAPESGPLSKRMKWQIPASEGFRQGRQAIRMRVLAGHAVGVEVSV
jgi:hypothetical protein